MPETKIIPPSVAPEPARPEPDRPVKLPDMSLSASSETYVDQQRESELIFGRLHTSPSSVLGIAGVRGSGKSSLALKVLKHCADGGYFTLRIPSSIGYEPQEYLVSVYQRLCEAVVSRLEEILGEVVSLEELGRAELRKLTRRAAIIISGGIVLFAVPSISSFFTYWKVIREANSAAAARAHAPASIFFGTTIPLILGTLLFYVTLVLLVIASRRIITRYRRLRRYPAHVGLYQQSQRNLENLRYQTTLKTSSEASGTIHGLAAKFTRGKDLAVRPMSLPGITAECNAFLSQVAGVMGSKVIVCLDELDKIADPEQLASLLRGVKGLFGQPRIYFLLVVSEDAMSTFAARRQGDPGILESSIDEIFYLDRVPIPGATRIISRMTGTTENVDDRKFSDNCVLMWAFGFGIPREIKRNVLTCQSAGHNLHADDPLDIWRTLYLALIESLRYWALAIRDETRSYVSLRCLDDIGGYLQATPTDRASLLKCVGKIVTTCSTYSPHRTQSEAHVQLAEAGGDDTKVDPSIRRVALELEIGLLALLSVTTSAEGRDGVRSRLMEVFPIVRASPRFATMKTRALLRELGALERVGA